MFQGVESCRDAEQDEQRLTFTGQFQWGGGEGSQFKSG